MNIGKITAGARIVAGGVVVAAVIYVLLCIPGFMSDDSSTVPLATMRETRR